MPGADGRLREVHWRDVARLQMPQRLRQLPLERGHELPPRRRRRIRRSRPAYEDDAGGKGVGVSANHAVAQFRPHGPSTAGAKSRANDCIKKRLPTSASGAGFALALRLFESVVNRNGKSWVRLLGEPAHRARHAFEEERLRLVLAAVSVWRSDQLLALGHCDCCEKFEEDLSQRAPQPYVKEIGKVGVTDIVVVRRIGRDTFSTLIICVPASI
jgi:hypothetical protein